MFAHSGRPEPLAPPWLSRIAETGIVVAFLHSWNLLGCEHLRESSKEDVAVSISQISGRYYSNVRDRVVVLSCLVIWGVRIQLRGRGGSNFFFIKNSLVRR